MSYTLSHVFISYARIDGQEFAHKLRTDLEVKGIKTWLDHNNIGGGEDFYVAIEQGLRQARAVIVVLTPGAVLSRQVRGE